MVSDHNPDLLSADTWWPGATRPFLISGPCSAETEEQVLATATRLKATGLVHALRAGLWKPRTRPDSFEGVGKDGIPWLIAAREATGIPVMTEVATTEHVELCLNAGIDMLWIGARTTVNPFSVQEIAEALRGVDIPVLVKNPMNADLQLWIGGIERIHRSGVRRIAAIHRGFSFYGEKRYRNRPLWEIPIGLKSLHPEIPIFCDPSHITGRRAMLAEVAQQAMDLGMNGLMIESHITPDEAWSDAAQQITPEALAELIGQLQLRTARPDQFTSDELELLRAEIDKFDEEIIGLIAQRMMVSERVGEYKAVHHMQPFDVERWNEIRRTRSGWAKDLGLSDEFIMRYLEQLHNESLRRQTRVMNNPHFTPSPEGNTHS
ncbi:MAG: chorismate mutase [Flavobacteriales bacterium]